MADDEKQEEKPKKSGGGKGLMIALIVVIVILLSALGGGGYYLYSSGALDTILNKDTANKVDKQSNTKDNKETESNDEDNTVAKFTSQFKDIVLNITKNNGRNALMKLAFTIKSTEETIDARAQENNAEIMDSVINIISTKTAEELSTIGGKEVLKEELIIAINDILNDAINEDNEGDAKKDGVKKLFFVNFVIK